jgi:hypothetical protein
MTTLNLEELASRLSEDQRRVVVAMTGGEWVYRLAQTAQDAGLPIDDVRKAMRHLRKIGIAEYGTLWNEDKGRANGSGTWLNGIGLALREHLTLKDKPCLIVKNSTSSLEASR